MNNKALTTVQGILIIIVLVIAVIAAAFALSGAPTETAPSDITVFIDTVQQNVNLTQPQTLDWGAVVAGNTYTRNFTVTNTGTQGLNLLLLTTEPYGATQTWLYNNTKLEPNTYASGSLVLNLAPNANGGIYTWRLLATNNTIIQPTPTPVATPEPNETYQFTINTGTGAANINVTINTNKITLLPASLPYTIIYHQGDAVTFRTEAITGYSFNFWEIPGDTPTNANPFTLQNPHGNFTITATYIVSQPPT